MNIFDKIFCRVYQFAFKVALPLLPYRKPTLLEDNKHVAKLLKEKKIENVLVVTDATLVKLGVADSLLDALQKSEIKYSIYDKTKPNPTLENVNEAVSVYKENNCSAIIGFGGGSAIDCGKVVGACIARPDKKVEDMQGIFKVMRKTPLYIAVPTTAGTGSETTLAAIITNPATEQKFPINDFFLIPEYALLDPKVTVGLPKHLTATTGLDALVHAVEAYIGNTTNNETRTYSKTAVKLIFENLKEAYVNPENLEARKNMLEASYWAGNAFTRSYVGYVHALSHAVSGKYGTAHGLANSVFFLPVLERYGSKIYKKLYELALYVGICEKTDTHEQGAKKFLAEIRRLKRDLNIQSTLPEIMKSDIRQLTINAAHEANPLYPVPILLDNKELEGFCCEVMGECYERARNQEYYRKTADFLFGRRNFINKIPQGCLEEIKR